jgi:hypothetical protein
MECLMRKNLIAMSVAAFVGGLGMAGGAAAAVLVDNAAVSTSNAVSSSLRQSGAGHQLFVPYYNTQAGNATLFNIVNSDTVNGKAVKIRFRGGSNSDDVFDFQLLMSPGDVWAANISRGPNGVARLTTTDRTCTLPAGVGGGAGSDFVTARLPGNLTGDALATQTREGYIEIFNMADIPPNAINADGTAAAGANALFTAVKHVAATNTPPCTATVLNTLATDPTTLATARSMGLRSPSTGLYANWTIVNVPKSGSATGEAAAITAVDANNFPGRGNIVFFPQTGAAAVNIDDNTNDPALRTAGVLNAAGVAYTPVPIVVASMFDLPDMSTPYLPATVNNPELYALILASAMATTSVSNEFLTDTSINAFTDWTFSMPMRRYAVALDYRPLVASPATAALRAFTPSIFYAPANTSVQGAQICVTTSGVTFFNREELTAVGDNFVISPNPPAPGFRLCGETSVLTFNSTGASVLGAEIARTNFSTGTVRDGWARVDTPGLGWGLPIVGKSFSSAATGTFNLGGSWEHRYVPVFPNPIVP